MALEMDGIPRGWRRHGGHREGPLSAGTQWYPWYRLVQVGPHPLGTCVLCLGRWGGSLTLTPSSRISGLWSTTPHQVFPFWCLCAKTNKRAKTLTCLSSAGKKVVHVYHLLYGQKPNECRITVPILQMKKLKTPRCTCLCLVSVLYRPILRSPDSHRYIFSKGTVLSVTSLTTLWESWARQRWQEMFFSSRPHENKSLRQHTWVCLVF